MTENTSIGQPITRLDGPQKVTGTAKYAGDYAANDLLYGYVVNSTITRGRILRLDASEALSLPGVHAVFSHENRPSLAWFDIQYADMDAPPGNVFRPLHSADILYNGQPIALVVAETFELARYAAGTLTIVYEKDNFETNIFNVIDAAHDPKKGLQSGMKPPPPKPTGDARAAFAAAPYKVSADFMHSTEHHNPLELFATTTIYEGNGKLRIYDKTQGTINSQLYVANIFGLHYQNVRVIAPFVGGAFGSGLRPQHQLFFSALAALQLKRNVRVTLDRQQMFSFGHRPPTLQKTSFAANADGRLSSIHHVAFGETSRFEDYREEVVKWSHMLYPAPNSLFEYKLIDADVYTPLDMRAPGGSTGMHAVEITMDELSYQLKTDPVAFRLQNYSTKDPSSGKPFSSKALKECYLQGAEKFGWNKRNPELRSMRHGAKLIGYGMATGIWDASQVPARASAEINSDGKFIIRNAVTDIGTGTRTVMAQIAADAMGISAQEVEFEYADSKLPFAPIQGGSFTTSTVGIAVKKVCGILKKKLFSIALKKDLLKKAAFENIRFANGSLHHEDYPEQSVSFAAIIAADGGKPISAIKFSGPEVMKLRKYSRAVHSAAFVEVEVDEELGTIRIARALTAVAAGTIINPKTARSQLLGGMVWGISKALHEETITDHRLGKYMNANLAEYHIPVHADINELDVMFIKEEDPVINELGIKGVGEIGIVAMPPAISNAIYHATGKRINHLPIHFDELI